MMKNFPSIYAFPNNVNIFTHRYSQTDLEVRVANNDNSFAYAVFPLLKHRWKTAKIYLHGNVFKLNIETVARHGKHVYLSAVEGFVPTKMCKKTETYTDGANKKMTFECYSFIKCKTGIRLCDIDLTIQRGLLIGGNNMRIFSIAKKPTTIESGTAFHGINAFAVAPFASLNISVQAEIFAAWVSHKPIVITGGTGIGKTSQIPKLILWFNFLFGGFATLDSIMEYNELPVVLSLPRVTLVRMAGESMAKSIGFPTIDGSPIELRYGNMQPGDINHTRFPFRLIVSTHKLTLSALFSHGTVILDEIHEHDQMADIIISVARKHLHRFDSLILMTATLEDDIDRLKELFTNAEFVHIPGPTIYPIKTVYIKNTVNPGDIFAYNKEEIRNLSLALNLYRPLPGYCGILFVASVSQCEEYKRLLSADHPTIKFYIVHGKVTDIDNILHTVYNSRGTSILVSTPYLESSVTVRTATHVYDTGRVFIPAPFGGTHTIISRSMMTQRKGRVGRTMPGTYVYFYNPAMMRPIRRIDFEYMYNYIIYAKQYGLSIPNDLYIKPNNMSMLYSSMDYIESFSIPYDKLFTIVNTRYLRMIEYAKIYNRDDKIAHELDIFERDGIMTESVKDAIRGLNLRVSIIKVRRYRNTFIHVCKVHFGPYSGITFLLSHNTILKKDIYMLTDRKFSIS